jgi:KUP system potassium uptake protein
VSSNLNKLSYAGLLITLGIIFGDIGTSPLYVMKALCGNEKIDETLIFGGISAVFWTLTFQTTIKYVIITLRADNNGEGGIFSLFSLVRRKYPSLIYAAMLGGAMLLADGIITPPISISSAVEGIELKIPGIPVVPIVILILFIIFVFQQFGTGFVGKAFGPIMIIWFSMLAILGISQIVHDTSILKAINPYYAIHLLFIRPGGFWLLGAIFLCTTGAEALYSDLGHCGRQNIRISWIFVKLCLILNYFGQGAWLLKHKGEILEGVNPFYAIMPDWWLVPGIVIATTAAIIASQALISGSFTLVGEAIRLGLLPKVKVFYPSVEKGQVYISLVNWSLFFGCVGVVLFFKNSSNMEHAYGLAITTTMLMTTILLAYYLISLKINKYFVYFLTVLFLTIESGFLFANLLKFWHGGYATLFIASIVFFIMYICKHAHEIKDRLTEIVKFKHYIQQLIQLSNDDSLPKFATNLVFLSTAHKDDEVERKILYSILQKQPKRADIYWFVYIETTEEPYTLEYKVTNIAENDVIRVRFRLGFRIEPKISMYLRTVIEDMVSKGEVNITSRYSSLREQNITGDFKFVLIEEVLSRENKLNIFDQFILNTYFLIKNITASPERWFGLDTSVVSIEKVPLTVKKMEKIQMNRIE